MAGRMAVKGLGTLLARRVTQGPALLRPIRGGHGHAHAEKADPTKYGDFTPPQVSQVHKAGGYFFGTMMWFWILYRGYYDMPGLLGYHAFHEHDDDEHH